MALTPYQVMEQESKAFLDLTADGTPQFAGLDLSGCPSVNQPATETFEAQDRHGFNNLDVSGSGLGAAALKKGLADLANDPAVVAQIAAENPAAGEALAEARSQAALEEARQFMRKHPEYSSEPENFESVTRVLAYNLLKMSPQEAETCDVDEAYEELRDQGLWTCENLESAWEALCEHGLAELRPGQVKELSADEKLAIIRKGQNGMNHGDEIKVLEALATYCSFALGLDPDEIDLTDPDYRRVVDQGIFFIFEMTTPSYSPSPERREFLLRYFAGRPLSFPLVFEAWRACQQSEARGYSRALLAPDETQQARGETLDDLDDSQIENLYKSTRRYVARQPAGIMQ